jgi:hypothetical protein
VVHSAREGTAKMMQPRRTNQRKTTERLFMRRFRLLGGITVGAKTVEEESAWNDDDPRVGKTPNPIRSRQF